MGAPVATLSLLDQADGSATYSANGYTVIGAVNGPIEAQRRDELPEEAAIEVNVRPVVGVGGTKERHLESILQSTLRHVILTHNFPRSLIQLTLQVISAPEDGTATLAATPLPLLPALLQTAMLTLISASLPLSATFASAIVAAMPQGRLIPSPSLKDLSNATSLHVFAFSAARDLLVVESAGTFDMETWDRACGVAEEVCCGDEERMRDDDGQEEDLKAWVKGLVGRKVEGETRWKEPA